VSAKQVIVLVVLAVADLCVLSVGVALLLLNNLPATPAPAKSVALPATASVHVSRTLQASAIPTALPPSPLPRPTETRWPTWTPRPSETPFPTRTPLPSPTPTITLTPTPRPTDTRRPAVITPTRPAGGAPPGSGGTPGAPSNRIGCGTPNGRPTNGKLDVLWSIIGWRTSPSDPARAIGTMEILPSGGNDCYKYNFLGRTYDYEPIEFEMNKCGTMTGELIVTSADGQTWKQDLMISADDPGFRCR